MIGSVMGAVGRRRLTCSRCLARNTLLIVPTEGATAGDGNSFAATRSRPCFWVAAACNFPADRNRGMGKCYL
ncbi:hypothetical protein E2C01_071205 [Portunus trituberculatus]|uniref:Uncharacterized protein n=1 Tax=Portunus trituberculatus TaxID=210409 RepID=A0A5B7I3C8_PORTR|nr:hypothetical protein [Portunus trituberculatus]